MHKSKKTYLHKNKNVVKLNKIKGVSYGKIIDKVIKNYYLCYGY